MRCLHYVLSLTLRPTLMDECTATVPLGGWGGEQISHLV